MVDMILQNDASDIIDSRVYCGKPDQNFTSIPTFLHHLFDGLHVPCYTGNAVQHRLCLTVVMMLMAVVLFHRFHRFLFPLISI